MKILDVRFKNLNSLVGEWHVDFTHPAYGSDGIFAITGPTGAGKTTILDAVCLGLYGRTPRLDKVTRSGNEIMSRQTGECFAEVTFETREGRYRCHWSQHRARKHAEGELQPARHELANADSGEVLESKITQVGELIVRFTGMDFDRFTRSMLLAQGGFSAFLQAPPDERAPILEQITGTEVYSNISMKVHERRSLEQEKLKVLLAELQGIQVLSIEEETKLQTNLQERQSLEAETGRQAEGLRKAVFWLTGVAALEKELVDLDKELQEVDARTEAFAPAAKRLGKSRKALNLEGDYRAVEIVRAQQLSETTELDGAIVLAVQKEKEVKEALAAREAAERMLREARARQQSESDVIKRVRDYDVRLAGQKRQVEDKSRAIGDAQREGEGYKDIVAGLVAALKDTETELQTIRHYQAENAADAGLPANLPVITRELAALREIESAWTKALEGRAAAAAKRASALAILEKLEQDHKESSRDLEAKGNDLRDLTNEIEVLLKDRDIGEWRREIEAMKERERLLKGAGETMERAMKTSTALDSIEKGLKILNERLTAVAEEVKTVTGQKDLQEKEVRNLETRVALLARIRDLEGERRRLEDGNPCPLCGAVDHPFAKGNVPELGDGEKELNTAGMELKRLSEALGKLEGEQVRIATQIGHSQKEMEEKRAVLDEDERQCSDALKKLDIDVPSEDRVERLREGLKDVQAELSEMSGIVVAAEEKAKQERVVQKALEEARGLAEMTGKALEEARVHAGTAGLEHEQSIKESEALEEEDGRVRKTVLKDLEPFGVMEVFPDKLDVLLEVLTARKDAWQEGMDKRAALEKKNNDLKGETDKYRALLGRLEADLAGLQEDHRFLKEEYDSLNLFRRELFGEKDADREEKRLAEGVDLAEKALEKARDEYGKIEKDLGALKDRITSLKGKTGGRAVELERAEQRLMERIVKAGFKDEEDYRLSRLSAEEQEMLAHEESLLATKRTELEARRKDRLTALEKEREKNLADRPMEVLQKELTQIGSALRQLQEDMGAIKNRLVGNEKLRERQLERMGNVDARRKECTRWDELHQLIGSADGKKFRNFAQGLTFEIMVAYANRQLRKMTDRYLLICDHVRPLELSVIDNYQAGEIRSTKNLSGGESFLVSLALALGLSQMASRNVRVDSLFLDEGFGTLDEDSLETALETLAGLRQEGKLIGVISHVPALKERISTQIQVVPQTGGRSILEGPGCSGA
jgi:exonuclease SbcC